jgi:hypothetical protein
LAKELLAVGWEVPKGVEEVTDTVDEGCSVEDMAVEKVDDGAGLVAT